jgi:hypothetical protein
MRSDIVVVVALVALVAAAVGGAACSPAPLPVDADTYVPGVQVPDCRPNNDGIITIDELPVVLGAAARIRVANDVAVDVSGVDDNGVTVWDLSNPAPETEPQASLIVEEMAGQWFEGLFPGATVAAPLVPGNSQLGPLVIGADSWTLLGAASKDEDPAEQTRVVYDVPTVLYPFPLQLGTTATSSSRAQNALLLGIPTAFVDDTEVEVTGQGRMILPDLILENTLRVTVRFARTLLAGDVQQVSHHFVHECLGEVARFSSPAVRLDEELDDDFAVADEVWRLAL